MATVYAEVVRTTTIVERYMISEEITKEQADFLKERGMLYSFVESLNYYSNDRPWETVSKKSEVQVVDPSLMYSWEEENT